MRYYITDEQMSSIEWFHLQEDTEELRNILRTIETQPIDKLMKSKDEIRKRINILHEILARTYGKDKPYEEERLRARIDEDEWILNEYKSEEWRR